MTESIALAVLILMVVSFVFVYFRRKRREDKMAKFYRDHSLFSAKNASPFVRESLQATENLFCCEGNLTTANGSQISFYWWEWFTKTRQYVDQGSDYRYEFFLVISFAPNAVSDDFMRKAIGFAGKNSADVSQKVKDFFAPDTDHPFRAEKLADGSFLIGWQVLKERGVYEAKLNWLKNNLSAAHN